MNQAEIHKAMQEAGGGTAYVDLADGGCFILDGAFTLEEIAAMGDVARKAIAQQSLASALNEAVEEFGAERLAQALVEPKVGDLIRVVTASLPFYRIGDYARLVRDDECFWQADFNDVRNTEVYGKGFWAIGEPRFEVIR